MVQPETLRPDNNAPYQIGDENPGEGVMALIQDLLADTEDRVLHHTTFDYGQKTMALTLQGIILTTHSSQTRTTILACLMRPTATSRT